MNTRAMLTTLAAGRFALGALLVAVPQGQVGTGWVGGEEAGRSSTGMLLRAVGGRDMALALGTLAAQRNGSPLKPWLLGATLADAVDLVSTFAAGKSIPKASKAAIALVAGGAIVQQLAIVRTVEA